MKNKNTTTSCQITMAEEVTTGGRILPLTILASRETVAFDTNFACGLYMTVVLLSVLETLLDELLSVVPESST
jgi:hypothetical protein